jgi:very-short-patch-repair endonuclease
MDWFGLMTARGGVADRTELTRAGAHPRELTRAVRDGRLVRPRQGIYALPSAAGPQLEAAKSGGRLSCISAARSYGWWAGTDPRLHLRMGSSARSPDRLPASTVVHWRDSEPAREIWRVSPADCLRSVVRCADEETAVAVLDTAVSSGMVRYQDLGALFAREPRWTRRAIEAARPGSDSGIESIVRQRLTAAGHMVEQQVSVPGVGRVDMRIDGCLFVELDGFTYHSSKKAFENDRARDLGLAVRGGLRVRFAAGHVLDEWEQVLDAIRAILMQEKSRDTPVERPS